VIGICNTLSELTPCNSHFRALAEQVKIGVYEAGGFPLEFPVMSLGETLLRLEKLLVRRPMNVAVVALANKMARTIWALLTHERTYQKDYAVRAA
jgi:dihydroxyacid dehydratase/phosphogluconate dehydratase